MLRWILPWITILIAPATAVAFEIDSPSFTDKGVIPVRHTCQGADLSPALHWRGAPAESQSLALIVDDPDAPDPAHPRTIWTHWLLYNLPPNSAGLPEGIAPENLPSGSLQGKNDWRQTGYRGPCPPIGRHRYRFTLYALDRRLPDLRHPDRKQLLRAMRGHILATARLQGSYQKSPAP